MEDLRPVYKLSALYVTSRYPILHGCTYVRTITKLSMRIYTLRRWVAPKKKCRVWASVYRQRRCVVVVVVVVTVLVATLVPLPRSLFITAPSIPLPFRPLTVALVILLRYAVSLSYGCLSYGSCSERAVGVSHVEVIGSNTNGPHLSTHWA